MDTTPFHFFLFAVDIVLWFALVFWFRPKRAKSSELELLSPYVSPQAEEPSHPPDLRTLLAGVVGLGLLGFGLMLVIAKLCRLHVIQCCLEGLTYHGSVFLVVAAILLLRSGMRRLGAALLVLAVCGFGIGFDMLVWEPYHFVVETYEIRSPKVKSPLRIVFVADIQTDRIGEYERRTLREIMKQKPDLILLGGDYLQVYPGTVGTEDLPERFIRLFQENPLQAPLGVYAIQGNLDPFSDVELAALFAETGVETVYFSEVFDNLGLEEKRGPIDLVLLSTQDAAGGVHERPRTDSGLFMVMAGHYPNYAFTDYFDAEWTPDLMLAGHTHGGQFALPWYGPVRPKVSKFNGVVPRRYMSGLHVLPSGGRLLVSRGTGMERGWGPRIRFFCRPEISVIDLVPETE